MPRRRRKKSNVPALLFAESPVNIVHRMPSPVYCADNPPTADVVSIDGDVNLPWVSPQFNGISATQRRKRVTRSRRHTSTATQLSTKGKENTTLLKHEKSQRKVHPKLVPLHFVGEDAKDAVLNQSSSPLEDITLFDKNNAIGSRGIRPSSHGDETCDAAGRDLEVQLETRQFASNQKRAGTKTSFSTSSNLPLDGPRHSSEQFKDNATTLDTELVQVDEGSKKDKPIEETQKRSRKSRRKKEIKKRLFGAVNFSDSETSNDSDHFEQNEAHQNQHNASPVNHSNSCRKSLRLQLLREKLLSVPYTPVNSNKKEKSKILAYDTPEEDYGLSVRQRKLKNIRQRKLQTKSS